MNSAAAWRSSARPGASVWLHFYSHSALEVQPIRTSLLTVDIDQHGEHGNMVMLERGHTDDIWLGFTLSGYNRQSWSVFLMLIAH